MTLSVEGGSGILNNSADQSRDKINLSPEEKEQFDIIIKSIRDVLETEHKFNEGNNGVIFKVRIVDIDGGKETKEYAAKLLKVGDYSELEKEFNNQKQAYNILSNVLKSGENPDNFALIPATDFCQLLETDEKLKEHLREEGVNVQSDMVGVMVMDWVNGEDIATLLFKEVLNRKQSPYLQRIKQNNFNQLLQAVSIELGYVKPGAKAFREGDKIFETTKVERENENKLYRFLKSDGYVFPDKTVKQIKNTINLLESNGLSLWDSHARNVMVDAKGNNPYLIDFAPQKTVLGGEESRRLDSLALVRNLETLTTTPQEDKELEIVKELELFTLEFERYSKNPRWLANYVEKFKDKQIFLKEATYQIVSGVDKVNDFLFALLFKLNSAELDHTETLEFLNGLLERVNLEWKKKVIRLAIKKAGV